MAFGVADYLVVFVVLCINIGIGLYVRFTGNKQKSNEEFLLANRSMSVLPVAFSLMASFMSAITLLGVSNENYSYGTQFIVINLSYGLATPICAYLFLPVFFNLQATSAYEYLEKRFGKLARLSASIAYSLQMIFYMGIVLYAPAMALESAIGIDKNIAIVFVGLTVLFYCSIGGIKAVLFTDVFQSCLMFVAVFLVIVSGVMYSNGIDNIFKEADKGDRLELWNFNPDPTVRHSWWTLIIGGMFTYLTLYAVNQTQIQRMMTSKSLKSAQKALWYSWPILVLLSLTTSFSGIVIYYYYRKCDPLLAGRISSGDQLMPIYIVDVLGHIPGVSGLFVAGIFSASLSTVSSCLNSLAAVTLEDYFKPMYKIMTGHHFKLSDSRSAIPSKIIASVYGIVCIAGAYLAQFYGGILQVSLVIFGTVGGPVLGLFTLGMLLTSPNERGSVFGLILGIIISMWIGFKNIPSPQLYKSVEDCSQFGLHNVTLKIPPNSSEENVEPFYLFKISYWYTVVIGFFVTFLVGYGASKLLKYYNIHGFDKIYEDGTSINYDLFFPPIASRLRKQNKKKNTLLLKEVEEITKL